MKNLNSPEFKLSFINSIPVMTGYIAMGIGFGIFLASKGYGLLWSVAMAIFIYAGSMQYLAVNLIASGASLISVALTTLMVNARHMFYGISVIDKYRGSGLKKLYMIYGLTDETYSLVCNDINLENMDREKYYFFITLFNQIYWVIGCSLGSIIGASFKFNTMGIDFAMSALFITVATEQWLSTSNHTSAIIGFSSSITCLLIFGKENFLIPSMILIIISLSILKKYKKGVVNE